MGILQKIMTRIYDRNPIQHSSIMPIFTKYGMYQAKLYKDSHQEYLALMSQNFFDLENPIVYVHSDALECDHLACGCNNQLDLALKMICQDNGLFIFYTHDDIKIDALLVDLQTQKLQKKAANMHSSHTKSGLKSYKKEYYTIGFILKDLNLTQMQLITNDIKVIHSALQEDIEITKQVPTISFDYGDT